MATIHLHQTTTATTGQFLAGLTDFGPGRSELFGNSADGYLKVHDQGPDQADVTEGSGGVWERLHYDWSDPRRITMTTTDSNVWGGRSGHTYTLTQRPDGTTDVDAVVVREGKNLKGRLLAIVLGTIGKRGLGKALASTVKAIEARNYQTTPGNPLPPRCHVDGIKSPTLVIQGDRDLIRTKLSHLMAGLIPDAPFGSIAMNTAPCAADREKGRRNHEPGREPHLRCVRQ
jgi:hypothetical protein